MLSAFEFFLYCVGIGTLLVSIAGACRLLLGIERQSPREQNTLPVDEPETNAGLARRLQEFQTARFATPIVQRTQQRVTIPNRRKIFNKNDGGNR